MKFLTSNLAVLLLSITAAAAQRPNILWIFPEDLSPFIGCYGDPVNKDHTPTLDGLAAEGVLFERAYVTAPVCSASRSAIITGVMQTTTGTHEHRSSRTTDGEVVPEELRIYLPEGMRTIPELLRDQGYFTFNSGKDDYNFHYDRRALYSVGTKKDYVVGMNGWQGNKAEHEPSWKKDVWDARKDKSQPWFGQFTLKGGKGSSRYTPKNAKLAPNDVPIPPYFPDTPAHRKAWTDHYNSIRGCDAQVAEIIAELKADGELDNTIIFFFSDHGSPASLRHKQFCYEGGVHVPLIIAGKHPAIQAGTVRKELVSTLDISATTLSLAGAVMPDYLDGQDFFDQAYRAQDYIVSARDRCDFTIDTIRTVRSDKFRYLRNTFTDRAMLQPQYRDKQATVKDLKRLVVEGKLTEYQKQHWFGTRPEEELYDIANDPHQINNLAANPEYASVLEKHRSVLDKWITETDDKGQGDEDPLQLKATYELWKNKDQFKNAKVNPEYDQFK